MKIVWLVVLAGLVALSGCAKMKPKAEAAKEPTKAVAEKAEKAEVEKPKAEKSGIEMVKVESSTIDRIGYDAANKTLVVQFNDGGVYKYLNVPEQVHRNLMKAKSKGKYFHSKIKDKYESKKCD